jgi:hypothetical protein
MKKGFFVSLDLIITITLVVFLFGILGLYLHNTILEYNTYKQETKMFAEMNVVLNRLAYSNNSCDLVDTAGVKIRKLGFCISNTFNFEDLEYNVCISTPNKNCSLPSTTYISKKLNIFYSSDGKVKKEDYFNCLNGNVCDLNKQIGVFVYE